MGLKGPIEDQARQFAKKALNDPKWFYEFLMNFIVYQKERVARKEISEGTIGNYYKAIKLFCEMNFDQPIINWKKIARGLPRARKFALDRIPSIEEIRKLCEYPDRRIKPIVYTMISSGIRLRAFDYLQWKHVTPLTNPKGEVIAAKLIIYPGDLIEEYYTFCTPEAYRAKVLDGRKVCGEEMSGKLHMGSGNILKRRPNRSCSPSDSIRAKGFNERVLVLKCTYGFPEHDISEVAIPAGDEKFQALLDELYNTRNLLLCYRLLHFNDRLLDIELNIRNRERQLFKPVLRVFQRTEALGELLPAVSRCLRERREDHHNSFYSFIYRT